MPARGRRRPSFSSRSRLCLLGCRPGAVAQATEGGLPLIAQPTSLGGGSAIYRLHQASTAALGFGLPAGCTCFFGVISTIPFDQAASRRHPVGCPRRRLSCCILLRTRNILRCRCREIRGGLGGFWVVAFGVLDKAKANQQPPRSWPRAAGRRVRVVSVNG